MQRIIFVLIAIAVVIGGIYWWQRTDEHPAGNQDTAGENQDQSDDEFMVGDETWTRHSDSETGIEFAYRTNPDGYVLSDRMPTEPDSDGHVKTFILMLESDAEELAESTVPRENPPAITVTVFENGGMSSPREWADAHLEHSNVHLAISDIADTTVAGADAIRYRSTGLYTYDTIIVLHGGFVYVLNGGFLEEDSQIREDFEPFVRSVVFREEESGS